jgi:transketolase
MNNKSKIDMRDAFFDVIYHKAKKNNDLIFLSVDHGSFSLEKFKDDFPNRYINIGIAEQNMIGVASGLALSGKIVFGYGITPFVSLRVLEQITLDLAAMNTNVNIVSVGAGFTYSTDGPSHQGLQDLPAILTIPNISIYNSSDPISTKSFANIAVDEPGPKYIRIEKGVMPNLERKNHLNFNEGVSLIKDGNDVMIISTGSIVNEAIIASELIEKDTDLKVGIIDLYRPKPLPEEKILDMIKNVKKIVTLEEGYIDCGIGSMLSAILLENSIYKPLLRLGIKNHFCYQYGSRDFLLDRYNLSGKKIAQKVSFWAK